MDPGSRKGARHRRPPDQSEKQRREGPVGFGCDALPRLFQWVGVVVQEIRFPTIRKHERNYTPKDPVVNTLDAPFPPPRSNKNLSEIPPRWVKSTADGASISILARSVGIGTVPAMKKQWGRPKSAVLTQRQIYSPQELGS
jgi:hypothetical protein